MKDKIKYDFYPFNLEIDRNDIPVEKYIYKNRCVFKNNILPPEIAEISKLVPEWFFCGYTTIPKKDIPKDWWGNYEAPGLQQLAIHKGLTFCEISGARDQEKYEKEYFEKMEDLIKQEEKENEDIKVNLLDIIDTVLEKEKKIPTEEELLGKIDNTMKKLQARINLKNELRENLSKTDEGYVTFGFDCGHNRDQENPNLKDPNHVMMLVEQMEAQLMTFKDYYEEYKAASETPITRAIVRKRIMTDVYNKADIKTEHGIGHLLDLLAGKIDPDETIGEI